jgi:hypothetical protein
MSPSLHSPRFSRYGVERSQSASMWRLPCPRLRLEIPLSTTVDLMKSLHDVSIGEEFDSWSDDMGP